VNYPIKIMPESNSQLMIIAVVIGYDCELSYKDNA